jgi:peptidoglycan L-alanyl-D-glutamate endopeptidase CwlK
MPNFSQKSRELLAGCDLKLQEICCRAIEIIDFTIITGYRNKEDQDKAFQEGKSEEIYPNSKHNIYPSRAVDIAPYPVDWNDSARFYFLAGIIMGLAYSKGIKLRWGGNWKNDFDLKNNKSNDLGHFELI